MIFFQLSFEWLYNLIGGYLSDTKNEEDKQFTRRFVNDLVHRYPSNSKIKILNDRFDENNIIFEDVGDNCVVDKRYIKVNTNRDVSTQIIFGLACLMNENDNVDKSGDIEFLHTEWDDLLDYCEYQIIDLEY